MTYTKLLQKLKASQLKVQKLHDLLVETEKKIRVQIAEEEVSQKNILAEIQQCIEEDTGHTLQLSDVRIDKSEVYDRDKIIQFISEHMGSKTFKEITNLLNQQGFKPKSATQFTEGTVYQLWKNAKKS